MNKLHKYNLISTSGVCKNTYEKLMNRIISILSYIIYKYNHIDD